MRQPPRCRIRVASIVVALGLAVAAFNSPANATTGLRPVALIAATPSTGTAPVSVTLDASASYDPDGHIVSYAFRLDNGAPDVHTTSPVVSATYIQNATYTVGVTVTDDTGKTRYASTKVKLTAPATTKPPTTTQPPTTTTKPPTTTSPPTTTTTTATPTTTTTTPPVSGADVTVPGDLLNLSNWKLTLPIATTKPGTPGEIVQPQLARYALPPFFMLNPAKTGVVFAAPVGGVATSNSGYPRSELREMNGSALASWDDTVGTSTMTVTEAITHLPVVKPQIVAGQVHDANDDVFEVRLEGSLLKVDHNGTNLGTLDANYVLGTVFTLKVVAANGHFVISYNGVVKADYAHAGSGLYFKAGAYTQSNVSKGDDASAYGEVVIYALDVTHT